MTRDGTEGGEERPPLSPRRHPGAPGPSRRLGGGLDPTDHADAPGPSLLLVGGLDPTGHAGLARDIAVCARHRVHPLPVATGSTLPGGVDPAAVVPTPPDALRAALDSAAASWQTGDRRDGRTASAAHRPAWMKVGAVFSRAQADVVAIFAAAHGLRIVHDPVLSPSAGGWFGDPTDLAPLVAAADLLLPNEAEAQALGLRDGDRVHVTRGGTLPGVHAGTGCRFATRVACLLALGAHPADALRRAHADLEREIAFDAAEQALRGDRLAHWRATHDGLWRLLDALTPEQVPEVGSNFAFALPGAHGPGDVCGLAGRITIAGDGFDWTGRIAYGGPHHTGRIAVVLQEVAPAARAVMNHRYGELFLSRARAAGLTDTSFDRADEPPGTPSSMEWGLRAAVQAHRDRVGSPAAWPDLVWDPGGPGKEPMIRVLATNVPDLARKVRVLGAHWAPDAVASSPPASPRPKEAASARTPPPLGPPATPAPPPP